MGLGDQLIATGIARGAQARGKRIAFGDQRRIIWDQNSELIFRGNPNIARPGHERAADLEWVPYYKGSRGYNSDGGNRWIWNMKWRCKPGEMFFDPIEKADAAKHDGGFIVIEPNVEAWKPVAPNKDWGAVKYRDLSERLIADGHQLVQFVYARSGVVLAGVRSIRTSTFRHALAILHNAKMYIGAEGGLHHGAAAAGIPAVVLFGGFVPPQVTGYESHTNLTGGATACGSFRPCQHCKQAMAAISVDTVYEAARKYL